MDNASHTSQNIRPILRAMERSIDEARRKRSGAAGPGPAAPSTHAPVSNHSQTGPNPPANSAALPSATPPALQPNRPSINSPHPHGSDIQPNADQPARLKAKPKRWLSASA